MRTNRKYHLWLVAAVGLAWGCGGTAEEDAQVIGGTGVVTPEGDNGEATDGEQSLLAEEEGAGEDAPSCTEATVAGTLMVGDAAVALEGATIDLSVRQGENCLTGTTFAIESADGCTLEATLETDDTGSLTVSDAALDGCEEGVESYKFNSAASTAGLLAEPEWGDVGACTPAGGLALAGMLQFDRENGESTVVRIDGIQFAGNVTPAAGEGSCASLVEACTDSTCGLDVYGVECGGCDEGMACIDGACQVWNCPPPGPYGTEIGQTVLNIELKDCDGNTHSLQDLCGAPAGFFNLLAGF